MTTSSERPQTPPDYRAIAEELAEENERLTALARRLLGYLAATVAELVEKVSALEEKEAK